MKIINLCILNFLNFQKFNEDNKDNNELNLLPPVPIVKYSKDKNEENNNIFYYNPNIKNTKTVYYLYVYKNEYIKKIIKK